MKDDFIPEEERLLAAFRRLEAPLGTGRWETAASRRAAGRAPRRADRSLRVRSLAPLRAAGAVAAVIAAAGLTVGLHAERTGSAPGAVVTPPIGAPTGMPQGATPGVASTSISDPVMTTVPANAFANRNLTLKAASAPAAVAQTTAESTAMGLFNASRVLETVLAEVVTPVLDKLCWVVSLPPQYAPPAHPPVLTGSGAPVPSPRPATYLVVFIDAATGSPIFSASGTG